MPQLDVMLQKLVKQIQFQTHNGRKVLSIFDLDSTLYDVSPRSQFIFSELLSDSETQKRFPLEIRKLSTMQVFESDWGIQDVLARARVKNIEFQKYAIDFWSFRFFSNEYLKHDRPYDGAVFFVNQIYSKANSHLKYLTGRDQIRMGPGTLKSLSDWLFPVGAKDIELVLKPKPKINDIEFKVEQIKKIVNFFDQIYLFENEPSIVHAVEAEFSKVQVIFMDSVHSRKAEPYASWPFLEKSFLHKIK